jgi:hypothetical protein
VKIFVNFRAHGFGQMTPAPSLDQSGLGRPAQGNNLIWHILHDFVGVAVLAIASLAAGLVMNRLSSLPLPLVYKTSEQRFDAELTTLVAAPPFTIAPARSSSTHVRLSSLSKDMCRAPSIWHETTSRAITGIYLPH